MRNTTASCYFFIIILFVIFIFYKEQGFIAIDSFYHIALAKDLFVYNGPWLPFTIYEDNFPPRHFLFQFLLKFFIVFGDYWGAIAYLVTILSSIYLVYSILFKEFGFPYPNVLSLLLILSSSTFFVRLLQIRPIGLAILWLGLYILFIRKNKPIYVFLISYFFVLTYTAYITIIIMCVISYGLKKIYGGEPIISNKNIYCTFGGILCGFILNPFFPNNVNMDIQYFFDKIKSIFFRLEQHPEYTPLEWFPVSTFQFLVDLWPLYFIIIFIFLNMKNKYIYFDISLIFWSINLFIFYVSSLISIRFIDYLIPMFVIFLSIVIINIRSSFPNYAKDTLFSVLSIVIFFSTIVSVNNFYKSQVHKIEINRFETSMNYLKSNSAKGTTIVPSSIDSFPEIFFHNRYNIILTGMDFKYFSKQNPQMALDYINLVEGVQKKPSNYLNKHNLDYIFIDKKRFNEEFLDNCINDNNLIESYNDNQCIIYSLDS